MRLRRRRAHPTVDSPTHVQEQQILDALSAMRDTGVREVMTPRVDVVALPLPVTMEAVTRAVKESGHSRFPVYEGDLDRLAGVLFVKDLFRMTERSTPETIARRLRKPFLVPESARVLEVLGQMRQGRKAFAVVVDEHGGIEGVLTIKDLVSELVGELPDEFDKADDVVVTRVDAQRWLVDGACALDEFAASTGRELPDGEYVTLGGFLLDRFGRIPDEGDRVDDRGWEFRIAEMDRRRIAKVVVRAPSTTMDRRNDGK